jgi:hypothetical protein
MKIKLLLFSVALFILSCSKDDDPAPLQSTSVSIVQNAQVIAPPAAMVNSTNTYAQMAVDFIGEANALTGFTSLFTIPAGAAKSTAKITAANGRTTATGDYVVYEWTDEYGDKVAFQVSELADRYKWEVFIKEAGQANYLKLIDAEEKKDKSSGFLKVLDWDGANSSTVWLSYTWTRTGDNLNIVVIDNFSQSKVDLTVNTKTNAGSLITYQSNVKQYEMTWTATGSGTWKYYSNGVVANQGSWTV